MSEETKVQNPQAPTDGGHVPPTQTAKAEPKPVSAPAPQKRGFSRTMVKSFFTYKFAFTTIFPDVVFEFDLKYMLFKDAEDARQEWLSKSIVEQVHQEDAQYLAQVCDLLASMPRGFDDLQDTGQGPAHSFKSYVETSDPESRNFLNLLIKGVITGYWNAVSPREFRG